MDEKALFLQLLTKVYNKTEDEISALIYDDEGKVKETAFDELATIDSARVSRIKGDTKELFNNGYKKAKIEVAKEFESKFKEATGFDSDAENFESLVTAYKTLVDENLLKKNKEITPELVKQHPDYIKLEKDRVPKSEFEKLQNEHNQFKAAVDRKEKFGVIKSRAKTILDAMNPAYPKIAAVRDNLVNTYLASLEQYDFADDGSGNYIAIKNGERVQDAHGNPIFLDALAKSEAANWFTFLDQPAKGGTGNKSTDPGNQNSGDIVSITSEAQYNELMKALTSSEEDQKKRVIIFNAYRLAKESGSLKD